MRALVTCLLALVAALLVAGDAEARKVRVRGGALVLAQAQFLEDRQVLELSGTLLDDARAPIEGAWIEIRAKGGLKVPSARGCRAPSVAVSPLADGLKVQSGSGGEFCLRWRETPATGTIALAFGGDAYHGAAELAADFDRDKPQKLGTNLRFEPRPIIVDLDKDKIAVSGVLDLNLRTVHASRQGLAVELVDERDKVLAAGRTGGDGKVRLGVAPSELAEPGAGRWTLRFAGTDKLAASSDEQAVVRRAPVRIRLLDEVESAGPDETTEIHVEVYSYLGHGVEGARVDGGVVEAITEDGASAGSADVAAGKATLTVLIPAEQKSATTMSVRYLPSSPFHDPGPALTVDVPVSPPSIVLRVVLTVLVGAAGIWVVASWRRSKDLPALSRGRPLLTPGVHVVHSKRGATAWNGTVVDAHEGYPIAGVKILVRQPTLEGDGVLCETTTDSRGAFAFDLASRPDGAELVTQASLHSEERKALPAGGTLRIALITRRRAMLRRFVNWARIRGRPYDDKPEPTPGHVREMASREDRPEVREWASSLEHAAFGPGEVDEAAEQRVRDAEPGP